MYKINYKNVSVSGKPKENAEVYMVVRREREPQNASKTFLFWGILPTLPLVPNICTNWTPRQSPRKQQDTARLNIM